MTAMERKHEWKQNVIRAAQRGDYETAMKMLANNIGNRGNVIEFIEDICENSDPYDGE